MSEDTIHTEDVPRCPLCDGKERRVLYVGLGDNLFGAPGEWSFKECETCEFVFLDPRPTPEDVGKAYEVYYTHSVPNLYKKDSQARRLYEKIKAGYLHRRWGYRSCLKKWQTFLGILLYLFPARRANLDVSVMYLEARPGGRLVDVGCGSGDLIERMARLGWQAEGVDVDEQAIRVARERGLNVNVGTLETQRYQDASFDAITVSHVIEHVHDPLGLMRECHRLLKPGGSLVVVTPNVRSLGHWYFKRAWHGLDPPRHIQMFAPASMRHLAEKASFWNSSIVTTMQSARWMYLASRRRAQHEAVRCSTDEAVSPAEGLRGRMAQHVGWAALKAKADVGEEVVAVLEKR